jgi:drug/metabolite transporter (DMT)-like permease
MSLRGRELGVFLLLTLIWGTTWAAIRFGLEGIPPLAGVGLRFALAGAVLLALAKLRGERLGALPNERRLWLYNGFATFVVPYGLIYWAEQRVPSGLASVLFATFPLWTVLWSRWLLPEERATPARLLGVVLGFVGVAVIFSEDFAKLGGAEVRTRGATLLVAAAVSATGSLAVKRWGRGISALSFSSVPMLLAGAVCGGASLLLEGDAPISFGAGPVLATLYLALFGSALTFSLYFWLLARSSVVLASLISYTAPVIAVVLGILLFGEPITARMVGGGLLVLAGVAGVLRSD